MSSCGKTLTLEDSCSSFWQQKAMLPSWHAILANYGTLLALENWKSQEERLVYIRCCKCLLLVHVTWIKIHEAQGPWYSASITYMWPLCTKIIHTIYGFNNIHRYTLIHCTHDYFIHATKCLTYWYTHHNGAIYREKCTNWPQNNLDRFKVKQYPYG